MKEKKNIDTLRGLASGGGLAGYVTGGPLISHFVLTMAFRYRGGAAN